MTVAFYSAFRYPPKWCTYRPAWLLIGWCHVKLLPSRRVLCTPYNHAQCMSRHFMQNHIRRVHARLVVTCHLHFRQHDRDLLRTTAVTRGWNGTKMSQHRKLTLEIKFFRRSCWDSNPRSFDHESEALTAELSPLRKVCTSLVLTAMLNLKDCRSKVNTRF